jgi:hypothetical protein
MIRAHRHWHWQGFRNSHPRTERVTLRFILVYTCLIGPESPKTGDRTGNRPGPEPEAAEILGPGTQPSQRDSESEVGPRRSARAAAAAAPWGRFRVRTGVRRSTVTGGRPAGPSVPRPSRCQACSRPLRRLQCPGGPPAARRRAGPGLRL